MAFTVTARQSGNSGESGVQTLTTDSQTPTANSLLLVGSTAQNNSHATAQAIQTPSGGGWTYTQVAETAQVAWSGSASFAAKGTIYRADVDGSPSAHTITVDHYSGTQVGFYAALACDITGHDAANPIAQSAVNAASVSEGSSNPGSVTLGSTPAVGNLVVAYFSAGADAGGGFAAPTFGGQAMTQLFNQNARFTQAGMWFRVVTGDETTDTITCSDIGNDTGQFNAVAVEIAAESGAATELDGTDTTQAQTATAAALTQTHELTADATVQAQSASAAALTQVHELAADSATQAQSATAATLTQVHELQPSSTVQGQTATAAALVQTHELTATDAVQAQSADAAAVSEGVTLSPASTVQGQVAGTAALTQVHALTAADVLQAQSADAAVLTQLHEMVAASAVQAQVVVLPTVVDASNLAVPVIEVPGHHELVAAATGVHGLDVVAAGRHQLVVTAQGRFPE